MIEKYLDTRQLEAFVAVVSIGSMTGAAKALGKSQPVVSRLIQDLEQDIGFTLLHHNGPRIAPTEQGIAFFSQAELFLGGLRTISESARRIDDADTRPIEIMAVPALAASLVPTALAKLPEPLFPNQVHVRSIASENVVQAVVARTADVGLASLPLDNPGIDVHWIGEVPCVAIVRQDDPLAQNDIITPLDLARRRIIAPANPYRLRMRIEQAFSEQGIELHGIVDSNATYVSMSLARAGLGVAVVESITVSGLPVKDLAVLPLSFHVPFQWGVITALGRPARTTIDHLIDALEESAQSLPGFRKHAGQAVTA